MTSLVRKSGFLTTLIYVSSQRVFCEPYRYYSAYVDFFTTILRKDGAAATLEDYVFSQKANFDPARDADGKSPPQFLCRLIDQVLHPLIHVGYGLEFGLPGTLAEGLSKSRAEKGDE
jgi:hypothetical protein